MPDQIISIIGLQLYQPIADLVSNLIARPQQPSDRVSSNHFEGGYAAAIILLLATAIESFVQRDRFFCLRQAPGRKLSTKCPEYLFTVLHYRRSAHIQELFDLRNAIAHNHIWKIDFTTPNAGGRRHKRSEIVPGTHQLKSQLNPRARIHRTKRLRLNLVPLRLDRVDVCSALNASIHVLNFLSRKGHNAVPLTSATVRLGSKRVPFGELSKEVGNAF